MVKRSGSIDFTGSPVLTLRNENTLCEYAGDSVDSSGNWLDQSGENQVKASEDMTQTPWVKVNGEIVSDAILLPDGNTGTVNVLKENTSEEQQLHAVTQLKTSLTAGKTYRLTALIHSMVRPWAVLKVTDLYSGEVDHGFYLNLVTGVFGANLSGSVIKLRSCYRAPHGWQKVVLEFEATHSADYDIRICGAKQNNLHIYTGGGVNAIAVTRVHFVEITGVAKSMGHMPRYVKTLSVVKPKINLTAYGNPPTVITAIPGTRSAYLQGRGFNGIDQFFGVNALPDPTLFTRDHTVSGIVHVDADSGSRLLSCYAAGPDRGFEFWYDIAEGTINATYYNTTSVTLTGAIHVGAVNRIVLIRKDDIATLTVNNKMAEMKSVAGFGVSPGAGLYVGARSGPSNLFKGYMVYLRIDTAALNSVRQAREEDLLTGIKHGSQNRVISHLDFSRAAPANVYKSDGTIISTPVDEMRIGSEGRIKNVLKRTNLFTHSDWAKNNGTVAAYGGLDPDGGTGAFVLHEDDSTAEHNIDQVLPVLAPGKYTLSVKVKPLGRDWFSLPVGTDAVKQYSLFHLVGHGSVGTRVGGCGSKIEPDGNGFFWVSQAVELLDPTETYKVFLSATASSDLSYLGLDQDAVAIYEVQLEEGDAVSGYVEGTDAVAMPTTWVTEKRGDFASLILEASTSEKTNLVANKISKDIPLNHIPTFLCNFEKDPIGTQTSDDVTGYPMDMIGGPRLVNTEAEGKSYEFDASTKHVDIQHDDGGADFNIGNIDMVRQNKGLPVLSAGAPGKFDNEFVYEPSVINDGGTLKLFYSGNDGDKNRVGLAMSSDRLTWLKQNSGNPVIDVGGTGFDSVGAAAPSVILDSDVFKMWYIGSDGILSMVGYATSEDGITWAKQNNERKVFGVGVAGKFDDASIGYCSVIKDVTYKMWYAGCQAAGNYKIGYATSIDGIVWSRQNLGDPVLDLGTSGKFDDKSLGSLCVIKDGAIYKMWFTGLKNSDSKLRIGYATSSDGITWVKQYSENAVLDLGVGGKFDANSVSDPSVVKVGSVYKMLYCGYNGSIDRFGYATSADGIVWNRENTANAISTVGAVGKFDVSDVGSPSIVFDGTTYWVWYAGFDATNWRVGYGVMGDLTAFERKNSGNAVLDLGTAPFDAEQVYSSSIINDAGTYKMWYAGYSSPRYKIGYATSTDGIVWTKQNNRQPVLGVGAGGKFDDYSITSCWVINDGGTYKMWYVGGQVSGVYKIGYATSPDGLVWTRQNSGDAVLDLGTSGKFDELSLGQCCVFKDGATYRMFFTGVKVSDSKRRIGYATSANGIAWTKQNSANAVLDVGASTKFDYMAVRDPSVILDGTLYRMLYRGDDSANNAKIGYATSTNGTTWTKQNNGLDNAFMYLGIADKFDDVHIGAPVWLVDGGVHKMWYSGYDGLKWRIGYSLLNDLTALERANSGNAVFAHNPTGFPAMPITAPCVINDSGTYKMWFTGTVSSVSRIYHATSANGITWAIQNGSEAVLGLGETGKFDAAQVAGCWVVKDGSAYRMWYGGVSAGGVWTIGYATSPDGLVWTRQNSGDAVLAVGTSGYFDQYGVNMPCVVVDGATLRMFYTGYNNTNYQVGYAYSSDGISWTKSNPSTNPILAKGAGGTFDALHVKNPTALIPDAALFGLYTLYVRQNSGNSLMAGGYTGFDVSGSGNPSVLKDGATYKMWYTGTDAESSGRIGYATSSDGITWTKQNSGNPVLAYGAGGKFDDAQAAYGSVLKDGATYRMWYAGDAGSGVWTIGYATSSDGIVWTRQNSGNAVLGAGSGGYFDALGVSYPQVILDSGTFRMWYGGKNASGTWQVGYATSSDGISWTRQNSSNAVLLVSGGKFDATHVLPGGVVKDGLTYRMVYAGFDGTNWRNGYANSLDGIVWVKQNSGNAILGIGTGNFDNLFVHQGCLLLDSNTFKYWYGGQDVGGQYKIGYALIGPALLTTPEIVSRENSGNAVFSASGSGGQKYLSSVPRQLTTNIVFDSGVYGFLDNMSVSSPSVVQPADGFSSLYYMWYTGSNGSVSRIFCATSTDGLRWTRANGGAPVLPLGAGGKFDDTQAYTASVVYYNSELHMFYSGCSATGLYRIGYAKSTDGITWTKQNSGNAVLSVGTAGKFDDIHVVYPAVTHDGSLFHMFYIGHEGSYWYGIGHATSSNGVTWTRQNSGNPVYSKITQTGYGFSNFSLVSVAYYNSTYYMWLRAATYSTPYRARLYRMTPTANPNSWTVEAEISSSNVWEMPTGNGSSVLVDTTSSPGNTIWKTWRGGSNKGGCSRIGYHEGATYDAIAPVSKTSALITQFHAQTWDRTQIDWISAAVGPSGEVYVSYRANDGTTGYGGLALSWPLGQPWTENSTLTRPYSHLITVGPVGYYGVTPSGVSIPGDNQINHPTIVFNENTNLWWMFTTAQWWNPSTANWMKAFIAATSPDLINWTRVNNGSYVTTVAYRDDPYIGIGQFAPSVIRDGGYFKMWCRGTGNNGSEVSIVYFYSSNGTSWTRGSTFSILNGYQNANNFDYSEISSASVVKYNGTYYMFYGGYNGNWRIGLATSSDGVSFGKYTVGGYNAAVLNLGAGGSFDDAGVYNPAVWFASGYFHMLYIGWDSEKARIGYATSTNCTTWTKHGMVMDRGIDTSVTMAYGHDSACVVPYQATNSAHIMRLVYLAGINSSSIRRLLVGRITDLAGEIEFENNGQPIFALGAWCTQQFAPSVVRISATQYEMWYTGQGTDGYYRIGRATCSSWAGRSGLDWTDYTAGNPVFDTVGSGSFDYYGACYPSVLRIAAGDYRMWYTGGAGGIGYATSTDGITWARGNGGNAFTILGAAAGFPSVYYNGTYFIMFYSKPHIDGYYSIFYAISLDGLNWGVGNQNQPIVGWGNDPFDNLGYSRSHQTYPCFDGTYLYMSVELSDGAQTGRRTLMNTLVFTSESFDKVGVSNPSIIYDGSTYKMWYQGTNSTKSNIGYATSTDGIVWIRGYGGLPVLETGASGKFDDADLASPSVSKVSSTYYMWYSGKKASDSTWRIGYATSTDGLIWTKQNSGNAVLDKGVGGKFDETGVLYPRVIRDTSTNSWRMWYTGISGAAYRIGYATSTNGTTWTKQSNGDAVLSVGTGWEATNVYASHVVFAGAAQYGMWYTGSDGTNAKVGFATSSDGINWTKDAGNPILTIGGAGKFDVTNAHQVCTVQVGNTYRIWYCGTNVSLVNAIGHAMVVGGVRQNSGNPVLSLGTVAKFDAFSTIVGAVLYDMTYRMWYSGCHSIAQNDYKIGYATSTDGLTWTRQNSGDPVLTVGESTKFDDAQVSLPSIIKDGATYKMWYGGKSVADGLWRIGYATSTDCLTWTRQNSGNAVLGLGAGDKFDAAGVLSPCVIKDGATYRMWYFGDDGSDHKTIGYATSSDGITWTRQNSGDAVLAVGAGGKFDAKYVTNPRVSLIGSTYHMFYTGVDASNVSRVGYAISTDGITWTRQNSGDAVIILGSSGQFDDVGIANVAPVVFGAQMRIWYTGDEGDAVYRIGLIYADFPPATVAYKMVYTGVDAGGTGRLGFATTDLSTCTKVLTNTRVLGLGTAGKFDDTQIGESCLIQEGADYKLWYAGIKSDATKAVGMALFDDNALTAWARQNSSNQVLDLGASGYDTTLLGRPSIIKDGSIYKAWYHAYGTPYGGSAKYLICYATSTDGVTWTKQVNGCPVLYNGVAGKFDADHVTKPSVIKNGATYHMWYTGDGSGNSAIGHATSPDGIVWTRQNSGNAVLQAGVAGKFDDLFVGDASVILDGATYKMWYVGYKTSDNIYRIGYATSTDGDTWTRQNSGNAVVNVGAAGKFDVGGLVCPSVIKDTILGTVYRMIYTGYGEYRIGYATSADGITWVKHGPVVNGSCFDNGSVRWAGQLMLDGTVYKCWNVNSTIIEYFILGKNFVSGLQPLGFCKENSGNAVMVGTAGKFDATYVLYPSVLYEAGTYKMWYAGYEGTGYRIGYATSTDGITWTKQNSGNAVLGFGAAGKFDDAGVYTPCVINVAGTYYMFYTGWDGANYAGIGYATSTNGINWTRQNSGNAIIARVAATWESLHVTGPSVVYHPNGYYYMYYSGHNGTIWTIGLAYTNNLASAWTKYGQVLPAGAGWDSLHVTAPRAILEGTECVLFYGGMSASTWSIGSAHASDMVSFTRSTYNPIATVTAGKFDSAGLLGLSVVHNGSRYVGFYGGYNGTIWAMGMLSSVYGTLQNSPVIDKGPAGKFDGFSIASPTVLVDGTTYRMWYAGCTTAARNTFKIGYAISTDGIAWTKQSSGAPVLTVGAGGEFDQIQVSDPCVVNDAGTYRMWYAGYNGTVWALGYATSTNGTTWTRQNSSNAVLTIGASGKFDDQHVTNPWVIKDGSTWKMWYTGTKVSDGIKRIGYATSSDGITWVKQNGGNAVLDVGAGGMFDAAGVLSCSVFKIDSRYYMVYEGLLATTTKIGYAYSADGITWVRQNSGNYTMTVGASTKFDEKNVSRPAVVQEGFYFRMWYVGQTLDGTLMTRIGLAAIDNMVRQNSANAVLSIVAAAAFDATHVAAPSVIKDGNIYKMWYTGYNDVDYWAIGYATSVDGITWVNQRGNGTRGCVLDVRAGQFDSTFVWQPCVLKDGDVFRMWYTAIDASGHYKIGYAISSDGVNWTYPNGTTPVLTVTPAKFDSARVYMAWVIKDGATFRMWYSGHNGSILQLGYATSSDGISWTKQNSGNPVLITGALGKFDYSHVQSPFVIKEDSIYKMIYSGVNGSTTSWGYATSSDGITWTRQHNEDPVLRFYGTTNFDRSSNQALIWLCGLCVINDNGVYKIWYGGSDGTNHRIGYAQAIGPARQNSGNAVIESQARFDTSNVLCPSIVRDGGYLKMWYAGDSGGGRQIGYASSEDGLAWATYGAAVLSPTLGKFDAGEAAYPYVMKDGLTYRMWYAGYAAGTDWTIGYATSDDGIVWTKQNSGNAVLAQGAEGKFDSVSVYCPQVIKDGATYKMWYSGSNGTNNQVGYATSSDGITWVKQNSGDPVVTVGAGGKFDSSQVFVSGILYDGASYKMLYIGFNGSVFNMGYATSPNGIAWTKQNSGDAVFSFGLSGKFDRYLTSGTGAALLEDDGAFKLWYGGNDGVNGRIGYAVGAGLDRHNSGDPIIDIGTSGGCDSDGIYAPSVIKDGGVYKSWYTAFDGEFYRIAYATSADSINWIKQNAGLPVLVLGDSGKFDDVGHYGSAVIKDDVTYKMWFSGNDGTVHRIGYATSSDGIAWTKQNSGNAVLDLGETGAWDAKEIRVNSVVKHGSLYVMLYTGYPAAGLPAQVGMATSSDGVVWARFGSGAVPFIRANGPGMFDSNAVQSAALVSRGGSPEMFDVFLAGQDEGGKYRIGHAISSLVETDAINHNFSVVALFTAHDAPIGDEALIGKTNDGDNQCGWFAGLTASKKAGMSIATVSPEMGSSCWSPTNSVTPNKMQLLTTTYEFLTNGTSKMRTYLDLNAPGVNNAAVGPLAQNAEDVVIANDADGVRPFNGKLHKVIFLKGVVLTPTEHQNMCTAAKDDGLLPIRIGGSANAKSIQIRVKAKVPFQSSETAEYAVLFEIGGNSGTANATRNRLTVAILADGTISLSFYDNASALHKAVSTPNPVLFNQSHEYRLSLDLENLENSSAMVNLTDVGFFWTGKTGSAECDLQDTFLWIGRDQADNPYTCRVQWVKFEVK
jgi:predicted GH43/DUF377 family glycosyl hydrolase